MPVDVELAHEFRYRDPVIGADTLVVSISQSGETMDTLMAVKYARERGARTLSICNTQGATIPRESDAIVYTHAGPEVAVASTKAFVAQITALYLLGLHVGRVRGTLGDDRGGAARARARGDPRQDPQILARSRRAHRAARALDGRHPLGAVPRPPRRLPDRAGGRAQAQGARLHPRRGLRRRRAQARPDRAHRARPARVRDRAVAARVGELHTKVVSNIEEIRARGARVIAIAEEGDAAVLPFADEVLRIPLAGPLFEPLLAVVPLHIFAMGLATAKGLDVDQPRNLAKSVTVE